MLTNQEIRARLAAPGDDERAPRRWFIREKDGLIVDCVERADREAYERSSAFRPLTPEEVIDEVIRRELVALEERKAVVEAMIAARQPATGKGRDRVRA